MILTMRTVAMAAVVISGFAASGNLLAATCNTTAIVYEASGQFGSTILAGKDNYELSGEPFSISIDACEGRAPTKTGSDYAEYSDLVFKATVKSRLLTTTTMLSTDQTTFTLAVPATGYDTVQLTGSVNLEGTTINITANIALPLHTFTTTSIAAFPSAAIVTAKSQFTYSAGPWQASHAYVDNQEILDPSGNAQEVTTGGTSGATAPRWNETVGGTTTDGTVVWACVGPYVPTKLSVIGNAVGKAEAPSAKTSVRLHTDAVQVITAHADGTQSVRPIETAPLDPGASTDKTMLQFYASGVRDASEVHVQIAGQEVPVVYAGPAGHFPGLDEVTVEVPRSLSGMGESDVVLTADGESASPVRIHVQ
jgi:hypothetical protein